MSVSIDDLVSSFSASHVSQEAMDLATLQSQLANVIYYPSQTQSGVHSVTRRNSLAQPCTTPTATSTFHWDWDDAARYRGQSTTPYVPPAPVRSCDMADDEMEDEQAVEDLLSPHIPNHQFQPITPPQQRQQPSKFRPPTGQQQQQHQPFSSALSPPSSLGSSMSPLYDATPAPPASSPHFANTDPFYLAAVQTPSSPSIAPTAPSFFAQAARPAPNSPFNLNLSPQQGHHPLEYVLVGAGQSRSVQCSALQLNPSLYGHSLSLPSVHGDTTDTPYLDPHMSAPPSVLVILASYIPQSLWRLPPPSQL
ncbi:hypothetical protein BC827DRAFT_1266542 [Russula dissimulans]|nr:hypothetical protein BC827DRAFT_1266542 [Russula dissimulans]